MNMMDQAKLEEAALDAWDKKVAQQLAGANSFTVYHVAFLAGARWRDKQDDAAIVAGRGGREMSFDFNDHADEAGKVSEMSEVKRYGLHIASQYPISGDCYIDKRVEENGDWMKYSDHAALLARHNALVEAVMPVVKVWKKKRDMLVRHGEMELNGECDDVCICASSIQLDTLAALVGEEGR